jgi:hypothetical protein
MLSVPSCYWLALVGYVSYRAAYDWWDVMCAILNWLAWVGQVILVW